MEKQRVITISHQSESIVTISNTPQKQMAVAQKLMDLKIGNLKEFLINDDTFEYHYDCISILGIGAFGTVVSAINKNDGEIYAIKILKKDKLSEKRVSTLRQEADLMAELDHKNIVKFMKVLESTDYFMIVMELIKGGSLKRFYTKRMARRKPFTEEEVRIIMKNLLEGVSYIHNRNIIHRDLKLENILINDQKDLSSIKIVDFGMGIKFDNSIDDNCGTLLYMAPEVASSCKYTKHVDIWSCGIIMYILLTGHHPFYRKGDSNIKYLETLKNPKWTFPDKFPE